MNKPSPRGTLGRRARRGALGACIAVGLAVTATDARAQTEPPPGGTSGSGMAIAAPAPSAGPFGQQGQWAYSITSPDEFPFILSKTGGGDWNLAFRPAADTFIAPNVSVGGIVAYSHGGGFTDIGVGVRGGYNISLSSLVSVWLRGGLFFHRTSVNNGPTDTQTLIDFKVPFLFHVVPHFLMGVGPFFSLPIQQSAMGNKEATFGLLALVGGYL